MVLATTSCRARRRRCWHDRHPHTAAAGLSAAAPADGDPRFTYGLLHDIADVLQRNGFCQPAGADWAHLMTALGRFLYQSKESS
jgi:hypothetical protein